MKYKCFLCGIPKARKTCKKFMHFVCANIFGANVLKPIYVVIMIIRSAVIIINSVFDR